MSKLVQVKNRMPHHRGKRHAGKMGRVYWVNPQTDMLHRVEGRSAQEAGCLPEDAEHFAKFASFEVVEEEKPKRKTPPPPRPQKASVSGGEESKAETPDSSESDDSAPSGTLADQLPEDDDEWTIKEWATKAPELGIPLDEDDLSVRPKADLVARIRERAAEADAE